MTLQFPAFIMPSVILYFLFFCSGFAGLVYQVIWVREFGNVFGNTVYSASLVIAIFMLGLGAGSYIVGAWADPREERSPGSLLRVYGWFELAIAALGAAISLLLPGLGRIAAMSSSYVADSTGWFELSRASYVARGAVAFLLLTPSTLLMGGTLTLLTRHLVGRRVEIAGRRIAVLYGLNTVGAASGAFATDFVLVPAFGLMASQMTAVLLNLTAGAGALWLAHRVPPKPSTPRPKPSKTTDSHVVPGLTRTTAGALIPTSIALALSGFAAMGMEILWFRHFTLLLGGFRAVFSLLLTVILIGIGVGSLFGGVVNRRVAQPIDWLIAAQAAFVVATLAGLGTTDVRGILESTRAAPALAGPPGGTFLTEVWINLRPMLIEAGLPALLMGFSFPLANAVVQRTAASVGRFAGVLYLANTVGAVCGSLVTGLALLAHIGMQNSATLLTMAAAMAVVPLTVAGAANRSKRTRLVPAAASLLTSTVALGAWFTLPGDHVIAHAMRPLGPNERLLTTSEGVNELVAVTEVPGRGRGLITNGHPMSSTALLDQRYMRALAHIPLLTIERPSRVLVIGFGAGNTTHAATLHPSVERVEVADLSRTVLEHAGYFRDANGGVLDDRRVSVYVNDGRQHLQMQPEGTYDLVTLEPPPIAHAGVASLYSREFYTLARTRLKPDGFLTQWLPAYQVPAETSLAMIRAFIDVFPQSVLLSGMDAELLLVGARNGRNEIDPDRLARALDRAPSVRTDLERFDLGTVTEIIGTFVGSAETLARATRVSAAITDDRPMQEYVVRSLASRSHGIPASIVDLSTVAAWCPGCFDKGSETKSVPASAAATGARPKPIVAQLDTYLALLDQAYRSRGAAAPAAAADGSRRRILGSAYLGARVPDTAAVHGLLGSGFLREGRFREAADAFREALNRQPDSPEANRRLGMTLVQIGRTAEAVPFLRRAVEIEPNDADAQYQLGSLLLENRAFAEAAEHFKAALRVMPDSASAHNDLGIALARMGEMDQAIDHFKRAVALEPQFAEGRRNLESALRVQRQTHS